MDYDLLSIQKKEEHDLCYRIFSSFNLYLNNMIKRNKNLSCSTLEYISLLI